MNTWVLIAGLICLFTSCVHVFAGQLDPVRPFLKSDLPDIPKATLLACWHMVSATLIICGLVLTYVGWLNVTSFENVVIGISIAFIIFSVVFLSVGWYFFNLKAFTTLPQWTLLLPIGVFGLVGTI
ncbi:hypothetical protein TW78_09650 [Vibrio coralliilyticus]|uniref:Uncharacterized protein n=1 Tax=Vibrio coralliilyticus TaxID=190893 RepID=A0A837G8M2_9VIBR|nr:hypothetical protein [Vibrio coralliilyticus]KJY73434.1 hypothetical protein TW78_09650 [Vibrio coralliilyticus]QOU33229.1 hypothetical protein TW71_024945 [Vibrio coralliilyticus]